MEDTEINTLRKGECKPRDGRWFAGVIWLAGCLIAGTIGYQYGYKTRDAEKAKTGYILRSVNPITGQTYETWVIP